MAKSNQPAAKGNIFTKVGGFFKKLGLGIGNSFKNMVSELKKVTWPTRQELINYTLVTLAFMLVMGVIIGLLDAGAAWLVSVLIGA